MVKVLQFLTPVFASMSGVMTTMAILGNTWLHTQERFDNLAFLNGSSRVQFKTKKTFSGLFEFCQTNGDHFETV